MAGYSRFGRGVCFVVRIRMDVCTRNSADACLKRMEKLRTCDLEKSAVQLAPLRLQCSFALMVPNSARLIGKQGRL